MTGLSMAFITEASGLEAGQSPRSKNIWSPENRISILLCNRRTLRGCFLWVGLFFLVRVFRRSVLVGSSLLRGRCSRLPGLIGGFPDWTSLDLPRLLDLSEGLGGSGGRGESCEEEEEDERERAKHAMNPSASLSKSPSGFNAGRPRLTTPH